MEGIKGLKRFNVVGNLPKDAKEQGEIFRSEFVKKITCFVLGPLGTNMDQACKQWIEEMNIGNKTEIILCETPEESIERARVVNEEGHVAIFWTCAVYNCLCNVFFQNPDTLTFFIEVVMYLDEMQLATRLEKVSEVESGLIPKQWKIISHPSPAPLVRDLDCEVILTTSNAKAAELCAADESDACITTECARKIYNLVTLHKFGSPKMVFFGGITTHGVEIIEKARKIVSYEKNETLRHLLGRGVAIRNVSLRDIDDERVEIRNILGIRFGDCWGGNRTRTDMEEAEIYWEERSKGGKSESSEINYKIQLYKNLLELNKIVNL